MNRELMEKIAGEIALSEKPGQTIRKWRETFHISQQELARYLGISPSVISDYESGRRKSPGVATVKKFVEAFIQIDERSGGKVVSMYTYGDSLEAVYSIGEFLVGVSGDEFVKVIGGRNLTKIPLSREIYGYSVIDSVKAITTLGSQDYLKIYGWSSERALIFTEVKFGRSPMIAVRAHPLKPAMVVYLRPDNVDPLAVKLAELERLPLIVTDLPLNQMIKRLEKIREDGTE